METIPKLDHKTDYGTEHLNDIDDALSLGLKSINIIQHGDGMFIPLSLSISTASCISPRFTYEAEEDETPFEAINSFLRELYSFNKDAATLTYLAIKGDLVS